MLLKFLKISGFKSFAKPVVLDLQNRVSAIVGPNGSGKSNVAEAAAWVLGEQSFKSLRGKRGEDLIFNGGAGAAKKNKAEVSLTFSGIVKGQLGGLSIDAGDEIFITRTVYKDGVNEYFINDLKCRLKDIVEFLGRAGIGASRHHIISQGESDRILNVPPVERKAMIEEALGLRIYQLKREESERKLEKTESNINQVESLRREIQPHLRFLKKQVDRAQNVIELREKLRESAVVYFSKLNFSFLLEMEKNETEKEKPQSEFVRAENKIKEIKKTLDGVEEKNSRIPVLAEKINLLEREIGRMEGVMSQGVSFGANDMNSFFEFLEKEIEAVLREIKLDNIRRIMENIKGRLGVIRKSGDRSVFEKKHGELLVDLKKLKTEEIKLRAEERVFLERERELHQAEIKLEEIKNIIREIDSRKDIVKVRLEETARDLEEIKAITGVEIKLDKIKALSDFDEAGGRRNIEKLKIKIEETGGASQEMFKEYEEIKTRDEFLDSELEDLKKSSASLRDLIKQLDEKLRSDFKEGVSAINKEFQNFFEIMFGGGRAELILLSVKSRLVKQAEEEDAISESSGEIGITEEEAGGVGVEIKIDIPRKKIRSLDMLSGGERSLISIALLFAMSQVNPPPFLILDETDAALDESNSRKYAEMLKSLSKKTQLVIVTHNRQTMSAAQVLYGVTMGGDGISKLLSVAIEEAEVMSVDRR